MLQKSPNPNQNNFLFPNLLDQLDPKEPLLILGNRICWNYFEDEFKDLYSDIGKPALPIRLMVGLIILKYLENLSDENLVKRWKQNPYYQAFCGQTEFQWKEPCDASELSRFRTRIKAEGGEKILASSIELFGKEVKEDEVCIDTTAQEKNITFPTDAKQYQKIRKGVLKIAKKEGIKLNRTYEKEVKQLKRNTEFGKSSKQKKNAKKATKRLKSIARRLYKEVRSQLSEEDERKYEEEFKLYERMLRQKRKDKNKLYSLHEPHVYCMAKGKIHKRYDYGVKASVVKTKENSVIIGALAFKENMYDGHTLESVLEQVERVAKYRPQIAVTDRGYKGVDKVGETLIVRPEIVKKAKTKKEQEQQRQSRQRFRKRAGIEPVIGHLKSDYRLNRNYLKGFLGDEMNIIMSAAAWNFNKYIRLIIEEMKPIFFPLFSKVLLFPLFFLLIYTRSIVCFFRVD